MELNGLMKDALVPPNIDDAKFDKMWSDFAPKKKPVVDFQPRKRQTNSTSDHGKNTEYGCSSSPSAGGVKRGSADFRGGPLPRKKPKKKKSEASKFDLSDSEEEEEAEHDDNHDNMTRLKPDYLRPPPEVIAHTTPVALDECRASFVRRSSVNSDQCQTIDDQTDNIQEENMDDLQKHHERIKQQIENLRLNRGGEGNTEPKESVAPTTTIVVAIDSDEDDDTQVPRTSSNELRRDSIHSKDGIETKSRTSAGCQSPKAAPEVIEEHPWLKDLSVTDEHVSEKQLNSENLAIVNGENITQEIAPASPIKGSSANVAPKLVVNLKNRTPESVEITPLKEEPRTRDPELVEQIDRNEPKVEEDRRKKEADAQMMIDLAILTESDGQTWVGEGIRMKICQSLKDCRQEVLDLEREIGEREKYEELQTERLEAERVERRRQLKVRQSKLKLRKKVVDDGRGIPVKQKAFDLVGSILQDQVKQTIPDALGEDEGRRMTEEEERPELSVREVIEQSRPPAGNNLWCEICVTLIESKYKVKAHIGGEEHTRNRVKRRLAVPGESRLVGAENTNGAHLGERPVDAAADDEFAVDDRVDVESEDEAGEGGESPMPPNQVKDSVSKWLRSCKAKQKITLAQIKELADFTIRDDDEADFTKELVKLLTDSYLRYKMSKFEPDVIEALKTRGILTDHLLEDPS